MKMNITSPRISFLCFCLLFISSLNPSLFTKACHPNDKKALLKIKSHFKNSSAFTSWAPESDCCSWENIQCWNFSGNPNRVNEFNIDDYNDIVGHIPSALGDLPFLNLLNFYGCPNLTGLIPSSFIKLTRLTWLDLSNNNLTGTIPGFLSQLKGLELVDLYGNSFTGSIPPSLSLLPNIRKLALFSNKLTGPIPESFGSYRSGPILQLFNNQLSGNIPSSLAKANISELDVSENQLTGDASFLFTRYSPLDLIALKHNNFKFDFTNVDFPNGLKYIDISHNQIYGSLPKRLGQLSLEFIDVSYNQLCGPIPTGRRLKRADPTSFAHNNCLCGVPLPPCN